MPSAEVSSGSVFKAYFETFELMSCLLSTPDATRLENSQGCYLIKIFYQRIFDDYLFLAEKEQLGFH